jgi:hypothetical protein
LARDAAVLTPPSELNEPRRWSGTPSPGPHAIIPRLDERRSMPALSRSSCERRAWPGSSPTSEAVDASDDSLTASAWTGVAELRSTLDVSETNAKSADSEELSRDLEIYTIIRVLG